MRHKVYFRDYYFKPDHESWRHHDDHGRFLWTQHFYHNVLHAEASCPSMNVLHLPFHTVRCNLIFYNEESYMCSKFDGVNKSNRKHDIAVLRDMIRWPNGYMVEFEVDEDDPMFYREIRKWEPTENEVRYHKMKCLGREGK